MTQLIEVQKGALPAGKIFRSGLTRIGKTVFDLVNWNKKYEKNCTGKRSSSANRYETEIGRLKQSANTMSNERKTRHHSTEDTICTTETTRQQGCAD